MFESNYSAPCLRRHVCRKIWKEFQNGKGWLSVLWRFHLSKCVWGFPGGSVENAGDVDLIPGVRRSPGGENGNPCQFSCLENPMDRRAWQAIVHGVAKSWTWLSNWVHMHTWSTYLYLSIHLWTIWKGKKIWHWKMNSQVSRCPKCYWRRVEK